MRLRVQLLFLTAHVYTTADLASHRGFGVVPVRGNDKPIHFHGKPEAGQGVLSRVLLRCVLHIFG